MPAAHFDPWAVCQARGAGRYGFLSGGSVHVVAKGPAAERVISMMSHGADQSPEAVAEAAARLIAALGPPGAGPMDVRQSIINSSSNNVNNMSSNAKAVAAAAWPVASLTVGRATSSLTEPFHTGMRKRFNARHAERGEDCFIAIAAYRGIDGEDAQKRARAAEAATRKCAHKIFPALMDATLRPLRESDHSTDTIRGAVYIVYIAFRRAAK